MRRGELAKASGCDGETVRFYEKRGLLPAPPRTRGGHRDYGPDHLSRLVFIRRSRELGFTLDQIRGLLALVDGGVWTCAEVRALTLDHLGEIRQKIADLQSLERVLDDVASRCTGKAVPDCPVIDALLESPAPTPRRRSIRRGRGGRCRAARGRGPRHRCRP